MSGWGHQQRSDNVLAWSGCDLVGSSELASGSLACDKRAAKRAYDGNRGYQPVLALWAEQDVIVADEFRDGNSLPSGLTRWVPAGSGNRRVVEKALAALPGGIDKIYLRGDSALYEHELMRWLDERAIGYAISADMSPQLARDASRPTQSAVRL